MDETTAQEVQTITGLFNAIRAMIRRSGLADMASSGLPPQQINLLKELTELDGQTLNELSVRMALAHSTVSGIVDRLEQKKLVQRRPDPQDRRYVRIYMGEAVQNYVRYLYPSRRTNLMVGALEHAQPAERARVLDGLSALRGLMEAELNREAGEG